MYKQNREAFIEKMGRGGVAIFASTPPAIWNHDTEYNYRPDPNFYYLTGFEEPESICVIAPDHPKHQYILFVRPKDKQAEIWNGKRVGVKDARKRYGADKAYPIEKFSKKIGKYLQGAERLYYTLGANADVDGEILARFTQSVRSRIRSGKGFDTLVDPSPILSELRLIKNETELQRTRLATEITVAGHVAAMKAVRPGLYEYELEALVESTFRMNGANGVAFPTIVASGGNATTLHYTTNDCRIEDETLVLIDAGAEYGHYSGDVTRTFPANGTFTEAQREIYQIVLDAHTAIIDAICPGVSIDEPHQKSIELLTEGMLSLGLLKGKAKKLIKKEAYRQFYMYRIGHMLGLDVHDVNCVHESNGDFKTFQPGMVMTIEPGLYVADDTQDVPPAYLGIGVRIEDDILITEDGCEVLTDGVPKEIDEVEALVQARKW
ncbi:M24 family metallopeptidase [Candidatus Poribacteria bacterium]|nr:M24 family metallopeptidase [Candidatus Poribacteria bacterium]MYA57500.1 M24 family metallopeptidase [Candidatus Poribacteria bacterium]